MDVLGWIVVALVGLYGLAVLSKSPRDRTVKAMMRLQGVLLLASCMVPFLLHVSKFWTLLGAPIAFWIPLIYLGGKSHGMEAKVQAMQAQADAEGVPLRDIINRETERIRDGR